MLAYLLVLVLLCVGVSYLLRDKLGLSGSDIDVMIVGIFGFGVIEAVAKIIIGLFTGVASGILIAYLLGALINGAFCYYFFKKSEL